MAGARPDGRRRAHPRLLTRSLFIGGTSSNAGKSWMATAVCASLRRRGVNVAPFKAQNMSNHSFPCAGGGEIGRAQVVQAEACDLPPEPAMNPVLLKPNGDGTSQVIVHGKVWKTMTPRQYYAHAPELLVEVLGAYDDLARRFDVIVLEGAGSVSEVNLRSTDIVNLSIATRVRAPWILVADIERGGVFASVAGTMAWLTTEEQDLFRGFAINKFRGDMALFDGAETLIEQRVNVPCLGVFPFLQDLHLDAEDSLAIDVTARRSTPPGASIAVIRFPCLSNGTDVRRLDWADWLSAPNEEDYDFVILPGSKDTLADLAWLRRTELDQWILRQHRRGAGVIGICAGYQMLGRSISDPAGSAQGTAAGLGLLETDTVIESEKITRVRRATTAGGAVFDGYEIHMGRTAPQDELPPFAMFDTGEREGVRSGRVLGTYLHGALEHPEICRELFGVTLATEPPRRARYDRLADWIEAHARHPSIWLG